MKTTNHTEELVTFFKALSDSNRLKIVALLAQEPHSVEQLAETLGISSSTVSHHLAKLAKGGLVSPQGKNYYSIYQLELGALQDLSWRLLAKETLTHVVDEVEGTDFERKVVATYFSADGRLLRFPSLRKKEEIVLRYIARQFEPNRRYSEKEVNAILAEFNQDTSGLRRYLVEYKIMDRQGGGGEYWLVEPEKETI